MLALYKNFEIIVHIRNVGIISEITILGWYVVRTKCVCTFMSF